MNWFPINDPFGTHRRLLWRALESTIGPVLELGVGEQSTPFLHDYCEENKRDLVSCDSDPIWLERYSLLRNAWHSLHLVAQDFLDAPIESRAWGVALVDHEPKLRERDAIRLALGSRIVILHDADFCQWSNAEREFRFKREDRESLPLTVALSNYIEI